MPAIKLDPRFPEQYLAAVSPDCPPATMARATALGEEYRATKKALKQQTDEKKQLSKKVALAKREQTDPASQIAAVKAVSAHIQQTKTTLKKLEAQTTAFIADHREAAPPQTSVALPPQFSPRPTRPEGKQQGVTISRLNSRDEPLWQAYVERHPNACIYHSLATRQVIQQTFGHNNLHLVARNQADAICGILPLWQLKSPIFGDMWISSPYFNYGGVLADDDGVAEALRAEAKRIVQPLASGHIEYRDSTPVAGMPCREDKVGMTRALPSSEEALWQELGSKVRAQINKAKRSNTRYQIGREELIDDFYRVFATNMRDLGTPVYSKQLFLSMLENHDSASIAIIYLRDKPVAAGFILGWRNTLEIPWASTLRQSNQYNVNMLLYWHILRYAISKGYQVFDFGRSSKDAPTYRFKKQWGAEPQQMYWHYELFATEQIPAVTNSNPKYQLAIGIWQRLPVWLTKLIGPPIVKYIP